MADFSVEELAYAAGIIDGEGYIGIRRIKKAPRTAVVAVEVGNTDPRLILWLRQRWPDSLNDQPVKRKKRPHHHKPLYLWILASQKAENFLKVIQPYLLLKKDQCEIALAVRETITPSNYVSDQVYAFRTEAIEKIKKLNHRGR